jgi:hypothetical protein
VWWSVAVTIVLAGGGWYYRRRSGPYIHREYAGTALYNLEALAAARARLQDDPEAPIFLRCVLARGGGGLLRLCRG